MLHVYSDSAAHTHTCAYACAHMRSTQWCGSMQENLMAQLAAALTVTPQPPWACVKGGGANRETTPGMPCARHSHRVWHIQQVALCKKNTTQHPSTRRHGRHHLISVSGQKCAVDQLLQACSCWACTAAPMGMYSPLQPSTEPTRHVKTVVPRGGSTV